GQNHHFLKINALAPPLPSLCRCRRLCPCVGDRLAAGGRCTCGLAAGNRPLRPHRGWALPLRSHRERATPYGLAVVGCPLCRGPWPQPVAPLQGALATTDCPLIGGQAVANRTCRKLDRGWPPILLLAAFAAKMQ
ncbi:hypothetical protein B296_00046922, partial [Ensete ventricosum]